MKAKTPKSEAYMFRTVSFLLFFSVSLSEKHDDEGLFFPF